MIFNFAIMHLKQIIDLYVRLISIVPVQILVTTCLRDMLIVTAPKIMDTFVYEVEKEKTTGKE